MGCVASKKAAKDVSARWASFAVSDDVYDKDTFQQQNECSEGYLARAGVPVDERNGGDLASNQIENVSIPVKCDLSVDTQMKITKLDSPFTGPVTWSAFFPDGTTPYSGDVNVDSSGRVSGTYTRESTYEMQIVAKDSTGQVIDKKQFKLVAQKCKPGLSIKFQHPLPGSVCTSKCNPNRVHPVTGQVKPHKGCDFAYPGGATKDALASADGEVIFAGVKNGYGNVVYIGHKNGAGVALCVTKYAHLEKIYVKVGDRVYGGQPVGHEGKTGIGTGKHLHFEIRGGDGQDAVVYDPLEYIDGTLTIKTDPAAQAANGDADTGNADGNATQKQNNNVQLTTAKAQLPCSGFQNNQNDGATPPTQPTVNPGLGCDFESAFRFTMRYECTPSFDVNDPDVIAGNISTPAAARKCGYVNNPSDKGGVTKYGVAQNSNPHYNVASLNLDSARGIFKQKYWDVGGAAQLPYPLCVVHFDTCVLFGPARAVKFVQQVLGVPDTGRMDAATASAAAAYADQNDLKNKVIQKRRDYHINRCNENPSQKKFLNGWLSRCNSLQSSFNG
ncbi:hypothetical protein RsoM2USA_425 [Ralstonia phage RsoM2USA]|nr:hypothetical protein RsoM2USA_425 [Ralstonia phage RsoM2USA]